MATGLPLSMFAMSVSSILLFANWLFWGNPLNRVRTFLRDPAAWVFFLILLMHIAGGLYSFDLKFYWDDLRMKVPLGVYPLVLGSTPALSKKQWDILWRVFIVALLTSSLVSLSIYLGIYDLPINDFRDISPFISHIRLSLLVCVGISYLFLSGLGPDKKLGIRIGCFLIILWLVYFLNLIESLTGFLILSLLFGVWILVRLFSLRNGFLRWILIVGLILIPVFSVGYFAWKYFSSKDPVVLSGLEERTASGNLYDHDYNLRDVENGHYVYHHVCHIELDREWAKKSKLSLDSAGATGFHYKAVLLRYMASMGLKKDSAGFSKLSMEDIHAIEQGETNFKYRSGTIQHRIYNSLRELDGYLNGKINGSSLAQHVEYQKTGLRILAQNPWFGVGTGDTRIAFEYQYEADHSSLEPEFRLRAHNQYLSILIAFGICGFTLFLFALAYPVFSSGAHKDPHFWAFMIIGLASFFSEETLETQAGVSFFIFFYGLFVWAKAEKK